jgi:parallel beta-helix repeat protein
LTNSNFLAILNGETRDIFTECFKSSRLRPKQTYLIADNGGTTIYYIGRTTRGEVSGCIIRNNQGYAIAGAYSRVIVSNNLIHENYDTGIFWERGGRKLFNNVIYNNVTGQMYRYAGGIHIEESDIQAWSNIIWNNRARSGYSQIYTIRSSASTFRHCDVQGGWQDVGNINVDPLFVDPSKGDFHLQPNSPCADAGDPDPFYNDPEDPNRPGFALMPARGSVRNDMGAYGGPDAAGASVSFAPRAFSLLSPTHGDTLETLVPIFKWNKAIDPDTSEKIVYTLQIDRNQNFSSPRTISNIADTTYELKDGLSVVATHYWRVVASNSFGLSTLSREVFKFTIGNIAPRVFSLL